MPRETQQIHSVISRCKILLWHYNNTIVTDENEDVEDYSATLYRYENKDGADNPVVSFQYSKSISGDPGEFNIVLKSKENLLSQIAPGDWIIVYLSQGGMKNSNVRTASTSATPGVPQPYVIASSSPSGGTATVTTTTVGEVNQIGSISEQNISETQALYSGVGPSKTFYWTPAQYKRFREETDAISWSGNIMALAEDFDQKLKNGQIQVSDDDPVSANQESDNTDGWSMRCVGIVNRISRNESVDAIGKKVVSYVINGFDFGKVFTNTTMFFNSFWGEQAYIIDDINRAMKLTGMKGDLINTPEGWIKGWLRLALGPRFREDSKIAEQFHLPEGMAQTAFDNPNSEGTALFYDILKTYFSSNLKAQKIFPMPPGLSTVLWQLLATYAHTNINEIFYELDDSKSQYKCSPTLYVRMFPYAFKSYKDTFNGIRNDEIVRFLDLPEVNIDHSHIINSDIGRHDHGRRSMFFTYDVFDSSNQNSATALMLKDQSNMLTLDNPIKRYGLQLDLGQDEFVLFAEGGVNFNLIASINALRKHWLKNEQNLLSGTMLISGNPNVRIGKRLVVHQDESEHPYPFHYYIMQYVDNWSFPGLWTQNVIVNRGIVSRDGEEMYAHEVEGDNFRVAGTSVVNGVQR